MQFIIIIIIIIIRLHDVSLIIPVYLYKQYKLI